LYYTQDMVNDVTAVWKAAAAAAWNGAPCVAGSLPKREVSTAVKRETADRSDLLMKRRSVLVEREAEVERDPLWASRHGRKIIA